jgi:predicted ATPase
MADNAWFVITGGPSVGKTTLLEELTRRGYTTIPEAARHVIDEDLAKGHTLTHIRANEKAFQEKVARYKANTEASLDRKRILFLDRGMQDTLAYMQAYAYTVAPWLQKLIEKARYKKVFLLEPLDTFAQDYARTENDFIRERLQKLLETAYIEHDMEPVRVPAVSLAERADFILSYLEKMSL